MATGSSTTRKKSQTRQKIIDCTTALIDERGYDDVSVVEISRSAGITPPTFYNHFTGKDGVLGEIVLENHIGWANVVAEKLGSDELILDMLRALTIRNAEGLIERKKLFTALYTHSNFTPRSADQDREASQMIENTLYSLIRKGQETGEISTDHSAELLETIHRAAQLAINTKWAFGQISDDELAATQLQALELIVSR